MSHRWSCCFCAKKLDQTHAKRIAEEYSKIFPLQLTGCFSPLHAVTHIWLTGDTDASLYKSLVNFLLLCGADINRKDCASNTPLRMVLFDRTLSLEKRKETITFLLGKGADPAYLHPDDGVRLKDSVDSEIVQLLRPFYPLPLMILAVHSVLKNNVKYESFVPKPLEDLIKGHEKAKP